MKTPRTALIDTSLEELFADVVYELRGVDLNAEK